MINKMKLHLGCGTKFLPGFTHVDVCSCDTIDIQANAADLLMIPSNSVQDIYASNILEHFDRKEILNVLKEWNRVLEIGGTLHVSVPNFDACIKYYEKTSNIADLMGLLYGKQNDAFNYHKIIFNESLLTEFLKHAGFGHIKKYEYKDYLPSNFYDYSKAHLPDMDFENGLHMSLNMVATKVSSPLESPCSETLLRVLGKYVK
jgi:predicted SAM-dependent methyltransferase